MGSWSVILNVLLLAGVMVAIINTLKSRRDNLRADYMKPLINQKETPQPAILPTQHDDIIAVRKIDHSVSVDAPAIARTIEPIVSRPRIQMETPPVKVEKRVNSILMFLLAKDDRKLAGYELLQTLLAVGLRFGEGHLFHRHQHSNGQGPVLCSVAAATPTGMFDLQNIGAFSVRGLCIFMEPSGNPVIDEERFSIMLDTARQLSDDLGTYLLDDRRQPLSNAAIKRYHTLLDLEVESSLDFELELG